MHIKIVEIKNKRNLSENETFGKKKTFVIVSLQHTVEFKINAMDMNLSKMLRNYIF